MFYLITFKVETVLLSKDVQLTEKVRYMNFYEK